MSIIRNNVNNILFKDGYALVDGVLIYNDMFIGDMYKRREEQSKSNSKTYTDSELKEILKRTAPTTINYKKSVATSFCLSAVLGLSICLLIKPEISPVLFYVSLLIPTGLMGVATLSFLELYKARQMVNGAFIDAINTKQNECIKEDDNSLTKALEKDKKDTLMVVKYLKKSSKISNKNNISPRLIPLLRESYEEKLNRTMEDNYSKVLEK